MKSIKACFALVFLFFMGNHLAFSQVLVLGQQTALQKKVIGTQAQKQLKPVAKRNANQAQTEPEIDATQLAGVETVFLDAAQVKGGNSIEMGYVQAAMDKHIPVVLENIDKETMLKLAGIGINAKVAVVEGLVHERGVRLTIVEDGALALPPGVTLIPAPTKSEEWEISAAPFDTTKLDPAKRKAARVALANKPLRANQEQQPTIRPVGKSNQMDQEQLSTETLNALKMHAAKRVMTSKPKDERRGSLDPIYDNAIACVDPNFRADRSYYIKADGSANQAVGGDLPEYAKYYIDMNWGGQRSRSISGTTQVIRVHVDYDIWLYASTSPMQKWMKISTKGTGASPGNMASNSYTNKGFFTEGFYMQFGPYFPGGNLNKVRPENANDQTGVATSTGFSIGASAGGDASGPNAGINASYSQETTVSSNIDDFRVTNNSDAQWAKINYQLSSTSGGAYNGVWDIRRVCFGCQAGLFDLPSWATGNLAPNAEAVWAFPKDHNRNELLYFYQHLYLRRTWLSSGDNIWTTAWYTTSSTNVRFDQFPSVDFSRVQLPHLGIGAKVTQSSTAFDGHPSRAADGTVSGNYWDNSVTHTNEGNNNYWEIDLGENRANKVINRLDIWNRTDCCGDRLQDAVIFISDVPFTSTDLDATLAQVANSSGGITQKNMNSSPEVDGRRRSIAVGRTGRFIRIQRRTGVVSLAEVQVIPQGF